MGNQMSDVRPYADSVYSSSGQTIGGRGEINIELDSGNEVNKPLFGEEVPRPGSNTNNDRSYFYIVFHPNYQFFLKNLSDV